MRYTANVTKLKIMEKEDIKILINKYFEGLTSREEEKKLLESLLRFPSGDPEIDETLAVMGYTKYKSEVERELPEIKPFMKWYHSLSAVAAAVILIFAVGFSIFFFNDNFTKDNECYAYIRGERLEDDNAVMELVKIQLNEMGDMENHISCAIEEDLEDFRTLIN